MQYKNIDFHSSMRSCQIASILFYSRQTKTKLHKTKLYNRSKASISLAATKLYDFDQQTFFNTLVAYVDSFIAVFVYWSIFSIILSCLKQLNEIIFLLSVSILIFVTLIPVAHEGLLQLKKPSVFYFAYTIFITPGILLIALLVYTQHKVQLHDISQSYTS